MRLLFILSFLFFLNPLPGFSEVNVELTSLNPGESLTFRYRVRINPSNTLPAGLSSISAQGTVSSDQFGDTATDDPSVPGASNPTVVPIVIRDSDGDGVGDDLDGCPASAIKTAPGGCGCEAPDADTNANAILDCLLNQDILERLERANFLVRKLKPNSRLKNKKRRKAQRAFKKELRTVRTQINESLTTSVDSFVLSDPSVNLTKLTKAAFRQLRNALKTGSKVFNRNKKLARKAVRRLQNAIA